MGSDLETWQQLTAGAASGILADVCTHPLSTVKTRIQCQGAGGVTQKFSNPVSALFKMLRQEGLASLYRGIGVVVVAAAPGQCLYFGAYEGMRSLLGTSASATFLAGASAQIGGSLAWVPMDVIKERLQIEGQTKTNERYGSSLTATRRILVTEGLSGLYRAYWIHQATWAPFNAIYFSIYERVKTELQSGYDWNNAVGINITSSCIAGVTASVTTSPLDLIKTRLQVQRSNMDVFDYKGPVDAFFKIVKKEGAVALFDGVGARCFWLVPRLTVAISSFEWIKAAFSA